jgi:hypothetical protein
MNMSLVGCLAGSAPWADMIMAAIITAASHVAMPKSMSAPALRSTPV